MANQTDSHVGCTHCNCNNPMWQILDNDLFHSELISKLSHGLQKFTENEGASLVISGGTIRPLTDGKMDTVEAIGIHNGKVVASGSIDSVHQYMKEHGIAYGTKQLQPKQTLLPGLIEPHVHIVPTALLMGWLDLGGVEGQVLRKGYDREWLKKTIKDHVKEHKIKYALGAWILGKQVDPSLMPFTVNSQEGKLNELITFDCKMLDEIEHEHPLMMQSASMHTLYVNSMALKKIFEHSKEVQEKYKTVEGYLAATNGQLQEAEGMAPAFKSIPKAQIAEMALGCFEHLTTLFEQANSRGATFMYDAGMTQQLKTVLDIYLAFHQKRVRIGAAQICNSPLEAQKIPAYSPITEYEDVYFSHVKLVSDGSNQGLTGYQSKAYCCLPAENFGIFDFVDVPENPHPETPTETYKMMLNTLSVEKGWPMMIHANGDLAIKLALDVYRMATTTEKDRQKRNRIEHCSILSPEKILEMKELGVHPSFLIGHVGYWGYAFREAIFEDKAESLDLCKSALDAGLIITLHSDNEVSPLGPLRMMEQSITRIMEGDPELGVLNPSERITPEQALRAITHDAAWQCNAEKWVGSLAPGYFADFVILDQDPLTLDEYYMNLRNTRVAETWRGGVKVYTHPLL